MVLLSRPAGPHFLALERRFSRAEGNDIRLYLLDMAGWTLDDFRDLS